MEEEEEGDGIMKRKSDVGSSDSDESGSFESLSSPRHFEDASDRALEGGFSNGSTLREKVVDLVEKCERLERQKQAAVDLLADKKRQMEEMKERYDGKLKSAEANIQKLTAENERLFDRMNLSPEERGALVSGEKEILEMKNRMTEMDKRYAEAMEENLELRHDLREARLEMEELHDQFREDEALEFRELQKELESTAKNCRILQFKLRKIEKRCEQLELDKRLDEERHRYQTCDAKMEELGPEGGEGQAGLLKRRIFEIEEELSMAKEVSVKLHEQMEMTAERAVSYEHELERVSGLLVEAEAEKLALRAEMEKIREEQGGKGSASLHLPQMGSEKHIHSPTIPKTPSPSVDLQLIMRDLNDSLEREHDLREQLKFSEEEIIVMRKKMAEMEEELESVNHQLTKLASAKQATAAPRAGSSAEAAEREQELKLQIELSESEAKVLRRRLDEIDSSYEVLLNEVKQMRSRATSFGILESSADTMSSGLFLTRSMAGRDVNHEESVMSFARDIDKLKVKLIERNQYAERSVKKPAGAQSSGTPSVACQMVKSKSLEDEHIELGSISVSGRIGRLKKMARVREEEEETRVYLDARIQAEILEQEALLLRSKVKTLEQEVVSLKLENDSLRGKVNTGFSTNEPGSGDNWSSMEALKSENVLLRSSIHDLEEKMSKFNKEFLRMKFRTVDFSKDQTGDWNEIRQQVLIFEEENKKSQRKIVDLEADCSKLRTKLEKWEPSSDISLRKEELDRNSKDFMKERIIELEGELKSNRKIVLQREEEIEQLENEISEGREDMGRLMDAFKRREDLLSEELEDLKKKNCVVSDLLKLVTERAESTQKELEELREKKESDTPSTAENIHKKEQSDLDALRKQIQILQKMLCEEKRKSEAAEVRMKLVDEPSMNDEKKLKQHEKDITQQELSLCQKQLKASNDQISTLKERLNTLKETHENLKDDLLKVTKELEKTREQKETEVKGESKSDSSPTTTPTTTTTSTTATTSSTLATASASVPVAPPRTKEPASWRWEKQEMERQLKELRKKLDDSYMEMKKYQVRWKAAGEDIERESQIKVELGRKIEKLNDENKNLKLKVEEHCESTKKQEKHWERELNMAVKEREDAEKEVKQLSEMISSKDDIIQQKNKLIAEKERSGRERDKALRESTEATIVAEVSLRNTQSELVSTKDQLTSLEMETSNLKEQLLEKEQQLKQLDEQLRRRDDRLKEKDDFLQQINRKLTEKGNQVSDMDKTIRQIIRKLQARDCDLGMTNAELRRIQNELRTAQEKYQEAKAALDVWETKAKLEGVKLGKTVAASTTIKADAECKELEDKFKQLAAEKRKIEINLAELKEIFKTFKDEAEKKISEMEEKVKLAEEKAHASDLLLTAANQKLQSTNSNDNTNFTPSDAYKQMMKEKENLISEKFKLNEELNRSKRQLESLRHELIQLSSQQVPSAASNSEAVVGMTGSPTSLKKQQRPESLSLSLPQTSMTAPEDSSSSSSSVAKNNFSPDAAEVIACLRAKLNQLELHWRAEKATLEEYYDTQAQQMREISKQLQASNQLLRKECDSQLLVLQNSRRALSDLRHRFDLATIAWNEEKDALKCKADRVEEMKEKMKTLGKTIADISSKLSTTEAKKSEFENKLSIDAAMWKVEKEGLEEKIKALQSSLAAQNTSSESTSSAGTTPITKSTPFTRVSEFKARFEKFGRMGKKFEDPDKNVKRSSDGATGSTGNSLRLLEDLVKSLQGQITQLESRRTSDENTWTNKWDCLNKNYEDDLQELRRKLTSFEKKDKEYSRQQRILSELQFRFVDDACQWQKQRSQLEQQVECTRKEFIQHKESVARLVAEVKKLKVLTSNYGHTTSGSQSGVDVKTRSRSLTPSAEKLRILALSSKEKISTEAVVQSRVPCDDLVIQEILQAVAEASRLAEDINRPGVISPHLGAFNNNTTTFGGRKNLGLSGSFKRSSSTAEVTSCANVKKADALIFKKSSSQDDDSNSDSTGVIISVSESKSNRNSMYTSGTQSAYASRDHSPDSKFLPTFTLPRNQTNRSYRNPSNTITSHYPKAPPSMIITPSQTPHREQSVERANKADVDVNVVYRKLEAILASEDSEKNFNRRVAVVSGADDHYRRSTNDRNMFGESDGSDISFVPPADSVVGSGGNLPPSVTPVSDRFSFATRTLPMSMAKHLTSSCSASSTVSTTDSILTSVAMTGREARSETKEAFGSKQRSLSVSPRTARRQFYENYERVTKPQQTQPHQFQLQQPKKYIFSDYTAEHKQPGDVLGIESGFKPMYKSVVTTASACDINSTSTSTSAMSSIPPTPSSSSSVSKKFLRMFSTRDLASTDQDSSGKSGFLQSVKERRKFFGGKKASSVDSPIGVSIARIGVNILTEPAAPSNYQPPDLPDLNFPQSPRSTAPLLTPTPMTAPSISAPAVKGEKRK